MDASPGLPRPQSAAPAQQADGAPVLVARLLLFISGLVFLGIGIWAMVQPEVVVASMDLAVETVSARNEIRAVYGGMDLGLGLCCMVGAMRPRYRRAALGLLALVLGCMVLARGVSVAIDMSLPTINLVFLGVEGFGAAIAWGLLTGTRG